MLWYLTQGGKTYDELIKQHFCEGGVASLEDELAKYSKKYSYDILKERIVPEGVDVINKEVSTHEINYLYISK